MTGRRESIRLRGHHLICLHFFHGKGYDPEFIANLTRLLKKAEDGALIRVQAGPDDVCKQCPHLRNRKCSFIDTAEAEIQDMDRTALELLQTDNDKEIRWTHIKEKIPGILEDWAVKYCTSCSWETACTVTDIKKSLLNTPG